MKDKIKGFVLGLLIGISIVTTGVFAVNGGVWKELWYDNIKITLDNKTVTSTDANGNYVEPFTIDGTTYLPVRAISNALGLSVDWDAAANTVKLSTTNTPNNDAYSQFNGSYFGGGTPVPGKTYKLGVWVAEITNATENSLTLSFGQSESSYHIDHMILYRQENGSYYGVGYSEDWGPSYITIWLETPQRISLTVSGSADQRGTEYLYK